MLICSHWACGTHCHTQGIVQCISWDYGLSHRISSRFSWWKVWNPEGMGNHLYVCPGPIWLGRSCWFNVGNDCSGCSSIEGTRAHSGLCRSCSRGGGGCQCGHSTEESHESCLLQMRFPSIMSDESSRICHSSLLIPVGIAVQYSGGRGILSFSPVIPL